MTREVLQQALAVLRGCADHPDADDAVAAIEFELAQPVPPTTRSFKKLYKDNADGIEIERLKMRIEELEAAQPVQPALLAQVTDDEVDAALDMCGLLSGVLIAEEMRRALAAFADGRVQPVQPANQIHSCSYFCNLPVCTKAQRDELRDRFIASQPVQRPWVGLTEEEFQWCANENWPMIRVAEMLKAKNERL